MIPSISIFFMGVSALISIGLPVALFIIWRRKYNMYLLPLFIGFAAFILFKYILESNLHSLVLRPGEDGSFAMLARNPRLFVLYAVLATGFFEETARLVSFILLKKKYSGVGTGLSYGIGHVGIESTLVVGVALVASISISLAINGGDMSVVGDDPATLAHINSIANENPAIFLIPGLERLFSLAVSISLSVVVWCAVTVKGKLWLYPAAIGAHALSNLPLVLHRAGIIDSIWLAQPLVIIPTALIAWGAYYVCKMLPEEEPPVIAEKKTDINEPQGPTL